MSSINNHATSDHSSFHVDLKALPYTLDKSPSRAHGIILFLLGFLCLFVSTRSLMHHYYEMDSKALAVFLCVLLASLAALILSINSLTSQKKYIFHKDHVDIITKNIGVGTQSDSIRYHEFRGVMLDSYDVQRHKRSNLNFQTIYLVHPQAELTIPLYQTEGETPPRDLWKKFTKELRLAALEQDGDQLVSVAYNEVELPLQQRDLGRFPTRPPVSLDAPEELAISQNMNHSEINILTHRMPMPVQAIFIIAPLLIMIASFMMPIFTPNLPPLLFSTIFPAISFAIFLFSTYLVLNDIRNPRKLTISKNEIMMDDPLSNKQNKNIVSSLPLNQIENIVIKQTPNYMVIVGKQGEMTVGGGLSMKTLKWLQSYLRAAVVTA